MSLLLNFCKLNFLNINFAKDIMKIVGHSFHNTKTLITKTFSLNNRNLDKFSRKISFSYVKVKDINAIRE